MPITQTTTVCFILSAILLINNQYPAGVISGAGPGGGPHIIDGTSNTFEKAPIVTSDGNVYVAWWTNKTGNDEVLFRSSTDSGATFGDKVNLSNTTSAESVDVMISAEGDTVVVTWWERNSTSNEPVIRTSSDAGQTFGPLLQLSQNGTLGTSSEEQE